MHARRWITHARARWLWLACLGFALLSPGSLAAAGTPFISEFMASNAGPLADEDGDSSDWIEIFNPGPGQAALEGWFLTDDPENLTRWRFPVTNLEAGTFLIVFASGKDRGGPGQLLHTNFKLAAGGGYLALVAPDGTSPISQYTYPAQHADVSYGISQEIRPTPLVGEGAALRVLVPTDSASAGGWTGGSEPFDDTAWLMATNGIGFDESTNGGPTPIGWWDFNDASNRSQALDSSGGNHMAVISGGPVYTDAAGGRTGRVGDRALRFSGTGYAQVPDASADLFASATAQDAITVSLWIFGDASEPQNATVFYGSPNADGSGDRSINVHLPWSDSVIYWDTSGCCDPSAQRVSILEPDSTKWKGQWNHYAFVKNGATKEIWQNGRRILSGVNSQPLTAIHSFFIGAYGTGAGSAYHGLIDDVAVWDRALAPAQIQALARGETPSALDNLHSLIATDLAPAMRFKNSSAYVRIPFLLDDPSGLNLLRLRINYDDGFVCWLNGVEVARRNAPSSLGFAASAPASRVKSTVRQAEDVDLSSFIGQLRLGANLLAFQALNFSPSDPDFLLRPELVAGRTATNRFFATPTPAAPNGPGFLGYVDEVHCQPERGFFTEPMDVQIWTTTPGATLVYTTNGDLPSLNSGIVTAGTNVAIHVEHTTFLRVAAFKEGYEAPAVGTHSYIFPADVPAQQRPAGLPPKWPDGSPAAFGMDARVINGARAGYDLTTALLDLPSISVVMAPADLWSATGGLYANPQVDLQRAGSLELLLPGGQAGFQLDARMHIHGGSSEYNSLTPKHSFTFSFNRNYGPNKLVYPLFPDTDVGEFHDLVLRGNVLDSWANSETDFNHLIDGELRWYRTRASYVRDQWMRDSQLAQGHPAGHGRFVHLYLNGAYWGLYNLDEHLNEHFAAAHLGGDASEFDVIADQELKAGTSDAWNQLMSLASADLSGAANYQRLMGNNAAGERNPAFPVLLDLTNLVDYMILHIYAGADDWPWHNWVTVRDRGVGSTGFKFLAWDQEISINSLKKQHTDTGQLYASADAGNSPAFVYSRCRANAEFRQFFADRLQHNLFQGGPLSVSNCIARYDARTTEIDHAVVAESARWGSFYRPAKPYLREAEWLGTNWWMRQVFFPSNQTIALKRFRDAGLLSSLDAPVFSPPGGPVPLGGPVEIVHSNSVGAIYYTLDGSDPRLTGGKVAPSASAYVAPLAITQRSLVRARVLSAGKWSALVEAIFLPPQDWSALVLTEIMYNPIPAGGFNGDEFEFIELKNAGLNVLDLSGLAFTRGLAFAFTNGTLIGPGQHFVIGRNAAAFAARYPGAVLNGIYTGKLSNGGDTLTLSSERDGVIFSVTYQDGGPWPTGADGTGQSLQLMDDRADPHAPTHWLAAGPTPGQPFSAADTDGDGLPDVWELANGTDRLVPDADGDLDHDGMTNLQEYLAGTSPNDANSGLRIRSILPDGGGGLELRFSAGSERGYVISAAAALTPPVTWTALTNVTTGNDGLGQATLAATDGVQFFRVAVP